MMLSQSGLSLHGDDWHGLPCRNVTIKLNINIFRSHTIKGLVWMVRIESEDLKKYFRDAMSHGDTLKLDDILRAIAELEEKECRNDFEKAIDAVKDDLEYITTAKYLSNESEEQWLRGISIQLRYLDSVDKDDPRVVELWRRFKGYNEKGV